MLFRPFTSGAGALSPANRSRLDGDVPMPSNSVASSLVLLARHHGVHEPVLHDPWARQREQLAEALALVHRARFAADLGVRLPEQRVVDVVAVDRDEMSRRRRLVALEHAVVRRLVDLPRLPGAQPCLDLIGIPRRIARGAERFGADARGRLMMLAAAGAVGPHRDHHVGPREPDQPHVVADDLVLAPLLERLVDAERVAEVHGAREELLGAVEPVRGQQLLGAQHAERLEDLGADLVLSAVAARGRRQHDAQSLARGSPSPAARCSRRLDAR